MDSKREIYSKEFSQNVKDLEKRFHKGESYKFLQAELDVLTKDFIDKCYRFKIGDILNYDNNPIEPVNYSNNLYFQNIKTDLIIDYAYNGYEKGLNRLELLEIIQDSKYFHYLLNGNYLFRSFYGYDRNGIQKRADSESEKYIVLKYDVLNNRIAFYFRYMITVSNDYTYQKIHEIEYDITRKCDSQDLYFLRDECNSIKIGVSNDVIKRVFDLSAAMKQKIDIVKVVNNAGKYERILHRKFQHLREIRNTKVDGYTEWFTPDEELIDFISKFQAK